MIDMNDFDVDDSDVRGAFASYRTSAPDEVQVDVDKIVRAGRRRVRGRRLMGAAGVLAVVAVAGVVVVPLHIARQTENPPAVVALRDAADIPSTGRPADRLFPAGSVPDAATDADTEALVSALPGREPTYLDVASSSGDQQQRARQSAGQPQVSYTLATWVRDGRAAEALLTVDLAPVVALSTASSDARCDAGIDCSVTSVGDNGWLKVIRGADGVLTVSLLDLNADAERRITLRVSPGAVSGEPLIGGRSALGSYPISESDAVAIVTRVAETI